MRVRILLVVATIAIAGCGADVRQQLVLGRLAPELLPQLLSGTLMLLGHPLRCGIAHARSANPTVVLNAT